MVTSTHHSSPDASRPTTVVLVLGLGALLVTQLDGLADRVRFSPQLLAQAFTPAAGLNQALPGIVLQGIGLLAQSGSRHYALSDSLQSDALFQQRMQEGAYPIRTDSSSTVRLFRRGEPQPPGCKPIASSRDLILRAC